MSAWLPIESAPKDGVRILLYWPSYGEKVAEYADHGVETRRSRIVVNDREVTGFWGGCIEFVTAGFAMLMVAAIFLGLAAMFAVPFLLVAGIVWLVIEVLSA